MTTVPQNPSAQESSPPAPSRARARRARRVDRFTLVGAVAIVLGVALLAWLGASALRSGGLLRVRGTITSVEARDIGHASTLTLRGTDGKDYRFNVQDSVEMTPGHLREHMAFALPVTVEYRREAGRLVAVGVTD